MNGAARASSILSVSLSFLFLSTPVYSHTDLRLINWGGDLARAHMQALVRPWEQATGKTVDVEFYNGGIADIRDQVNTMNVKWDVVDMEYSDLIQACSEGLLEKIDHSQLPAGADGVGANKDFIDGALPDCGVGTYVWATVYAYHKDAFPDEAPSTIQDFFNVKKFPGKRGLRRDPRGTLEWALMAAGVKPDQVYGTLATPQGVQLAFQELEKIKPYIEWWETGPQPAQYLSDGTVTMSAAWNGRLFRPIVEKGEPFEIVWDGQLWELEFFGIPKGSQRKDAALEFISFATGTEALADVARFIPYGPVRESSRGLVTEDVKPYLPTTKTNMGNALRFDSPWWAENLPWIRAVFEEWMTPSLQDIQQRGARF